MTVCGEGLCVSVSVCQCINQKVCLSGYVPANVSRVHVCACPFYNEETNASSKPDFR